MNSRASLTHPVQRRRTLLVTGSSRGIGAAIRERMLAAGHRVLGVCRHPGEETENFRPVACDLAQLERGGEGIHEALQQLLKSEVAAGEASIDAVILNAAQPLFGNLEELSNGAIVSSLQLNLISPILVARALLPTLKKREGSNLIVIGSESALQGGKQGSVYCAAKFGLRGFAESLRKECGRGSGVAVTCIHPGMVQTPFFDDLDFAPGEDPENALMADEVAAAVEHVLSYRHGAVVEEIQLAPLKKVVRQRKRGGEGKR